MIFLWHTYLQLMIFHHLKVEAIDVPDQFAPPFRGAAVTLAPY
jgi:hypothetical protein